MQTRQATEADIPGISTMLQALTAAGKRTRPDDLGFVRSAYVSSPERVSCVIAEDGPVLGLQILLRATPGNEWDVTPGWGIIGTHVHPDAARRGIGRAMFALTLAEARAAGLSTLDAAIGANNREGLGYYGRMGFVPYHADGRRVHKRLDIGPSS